MPELEAIRMEADGLNANRTEAMTPILEIAIPTFNRCTALSKRLEELKRERQDAEFQVTVFDNGSTDGSGQLLDSWGSEAWLKVQRVPNNRGLCRNLMRCLEETTLDWLWLLSDDDPVRPGAVRTILDKAKRQQKGMMVFKAQGNSVSRAGSYVELDGFLGEQHVMNLSYISGMVFHRGAVEAGISVLAPAAYTMVPHALLALAALGKGHPIHTYTDEILISEEGEHRVSRREFLLGIAALPEFFPQSSHRRLLARQLRTASRWMIYSALAQVGDVEDLKRWRSMVDVTEASFGAHGAGWWGCGATSRRSWKDTRRDLLLPFIRFLPDDLLLRVACYLGRKTKQMHMNTHRDAEV